MPNLQTSRLRPSVVSGIVLLIAVLAFVGVKTFSRDLVEVRVAGVNHQNLVSSVSTNGKVEPVEFYQAHAATPGVVEKIYVDVGQKVKAGQLLVKMTDSDASAKLASATAALRSADVAAQDIHHTASHAGRIGLYCVLRP